LTHAAGRGAGRQGLPSLPPPPPTQQKNKKNPAKTPKAPPPPPPPGHAGRWVAFIYLSPSRWSRADRTGSPINATAGRSCRRTCPPCHRARRGRPLWRCSPLFPPLSLSPRRNEKEYTSGSGALPPGRPVGRGARFHNGASPPPFPEKEDRKNWPGPGTMGRGPRGRPQGLPRLPFLFFPPSFFNSGKKGPGGRCRGSLLWAPVLAGTVPLAHALPPFSFLLPSRERKFEVRPANKCIVLTR